MKRSIGSVVLLLILVMACSGPQGQSPTLSSGSGQPSAQQNRTMVMAHRYEPSNMAAKALGSNGPLNTTRLFNAALVLFDDKAMPQPYLADSLPQLNSDSWRVLPDGRMETTYHLRAGLKWHDGTPMTADDFVFASKLYKDPNLGIFIRTPQASIEDVQAPDPQTVLFRWKTPNPEAGMLWYEDFDPLPAHILEAQYNDYAEGNTTRDGFLANTFWTTDYVGAGPYRLDHWEPGVQMEGTAFDGHALGKPKIDHIIIKITIDENIVLAAVMAGGQFDYTYVNTLRFEHLLQLKNEWEPSGKGVGVAVPGTAVYLNLQQRPEAVGDEGLLDVRVRRALAYTLDRQSLNDGLFNGIGFPTESIVPQSAYFYPELDKLMTHYTLDSNKADQLMAEAGYTKDAEGFFANAQGHRLRLDFAVQNSPEIERMQAILSDNWRRKGFDVETVVMGVRQFTELQTRHTLPGLGYAQGPSENSYIASEIGTAANGWSGLNRTGWTNPEYERLWALQDTTLDQTERGHYVAQMIAIENEFLPGYPLYFAMSVRTHVASLQGPGNEEGSAGFGLVSPATTAYWNIQDWYFK